MKIYFNNEFKEIVATSLTDFLQQHWHGATCFAVTINQQFIARTQYTNTQLQENDRIELILPMQGG